MATSINQSLNILNTLLPQYDQVLYDSFRSYNPLEAEFQVREMDLAERNAVGFLEVESMAYGQGARTRGQRYQFVARGREASFSAGLGRYFLTFAVPKTDMEAISKSPSSSQKIKDLWNQRIKASVSRYGRERTEHFFMGSIETLRVAGTANEYEMFTCVSPDYSSGITNGLTNGIFDAAAPASQTKSVLNLGKSTSIDYVTQYGLVSTWESNGTRIWMDTVRSCRNYSSDVYSTKQALIAMADEGSFALMAAYYVSRGTAYMTGPQAIAKEGDFQTSIMLPMNVKLWGCPDIKPSRYSTAALTRGATYIFNPEFWRRYRNPAADVSSADAMKNVTWFEDPMSDMFLARVTIDEQVLPWGVLAANGLVASCGV